MNVGHKKFYRAILKCIERRLFGGGQRDRVADLAEHRRVALQLRKIVLHNNCASLDHVIPLDKWLSF